MDFTMVIIIAVGVIFVIGGPILGHLATKASDKDASNEMDKSKNK